MFSTIFDIFKYMKNWKKALLFSFTSYMVILFGIFVITVFIQRGFSKSLPILMGITAVYMLLLLSSIVTAGILFRKRLVEE